MTDGNSLVPPAWVTQDALVDCIILVARHHRVVLDEADARRLIRHIESALDDNPDETLGDWPFAVWGVPGQFTPIPMLRDYSGVDGSFWHRTLTRLPPWGDPPDHAGHTVNLAVHWYRFEQAAEQALQKAGLLPVVGVVPLSNAGEPEETATLAAYIAAGEGQETRALPTAERRQRRILAWLVALHQEQPPARPNLNAGAIRQRWNKELRVAPYNIELTLILGIFGTPLCQNMRGDPGRRNQPRAPTEL